MLSQDMPFQNFGKRLHYIRDKIWISTLEVWDSTFKIFFFFCKQLLSAFDNWCNDEPGCDEYAEEARQGHLSSVCF